MTAVPTSGTGTSQSIPMSREIVAMRQLLFSGLLAAAVVLGRSAGPTAAVAQPPKPGTAQPAKPGTEQPQRDRDCQLAPDPDKRGDRERRDPATDLHTARHHDRSSAYAHLLNLAWLAFYRETYAARTIDEVALLARCAHAVAQLSKEGHQVVLVHGGGKELTRTLKEIAKVA